LKPPTAERNSSAALFRRTKALARRFGAQPDLHVAGSFLAFNLSAITSESPSARAESRAAFDESCISKVRYFGLSLIGGAFAG